MQMSFGQLEMTQRVLKDSTLSKVNLFLNWEALRLQLIGLYKRKSNHAGRREQFDLPVMFKTILLAQLYTISPQIKRSIASTNWLRAIFVD